MGPRQGRQGLRIPAGAGNRLDPARRPLQQGVVADLAEGIERPAQLHQLHPGRGIALAAVAGHQHQPLPPGRQALAEGAVIGRPEAAGAGLHQREHHAAGTALQHQRRQIHRRLIDIDDHQLRRRWPHTAQAKGQSPAPAVRGGQGRPEQPGQQQAQPPGTPGNHRGRSSSRRIVGQVSSGAVKPLSRGLLARRASSSGRGSRCGGCPGRALGPGQVAIGELLTAAEAIALAIAGGDLHLPFPAEHPQLLGAGLDEQGGAFDRSGAHPGAHLQRPALLPGQHPGDDLAPLQIQNAAAQAQHGITTQAETAAIGQLHLQPPRGLGAQQRVRGQHLARPGGHLGGAGQPHEGRPQRHLHHPRQAGRRHHRRDQQRQQQGSDQQPRPGGRAGHHRGAKDALQGGGGGCGVPAGEGINRAGISPAARPADGRCRAAPGRRG